ncbi:MAG: hypothetical protein AB8B91_05805, partial [Rubripirellula sp.]
ESMEELRKVPRQLREELANGFAQAMLERNRLGGTEAAFLRYVCLCWGVSARTPLTPGFQM